MRKLTPFFLIALLQGAFCVTSPAQTDLRRLAQDLDLQWRIQRAEAERAALRLGMPIRRVRPDGATIELQRFSLGRPIYYTTENANSAATISTNKVYPAGGAGYGLTGGGVTLGEWDAGGVRSSHQEFGGRVLNSQGSPHYHSTHVAGTMIASGVSANAKGMAYGASLKAYDWNSDLSEMASQAASGMRVSNHSYGMITGWYYNYFNDNKWTWFGDVSVSTVEDYLFGFYNDEARSWDIVANNAPYYLIVKSAGNDHNHGPSGTVMHWYYNGSKWDTIQVYRPKDCNGGYDCISGAGVSKNTLVVGAVNDIPGGYVIPAGVAISSFSSWGPVDDGRIKPDVVANGVQLYSTFETSDNAYGYLSGTSMAAPSVTGSIGLLLQHQTSLHGMDSLLASTVKAIVIHTADEAGAAPGPDYVYGWGLMNTLSAVDLMQLDHDEGTASHILELGLTDGDTLDVTVSCSGGGPLKATICWNDPAGTIPFASLDPTTSNLVDDIDMRIIRLDNGETSFPWTLDPSSPSSAASTGDNFRDNVEQVWLDTAARGVYAVRLTHKGSLSSSPFPVSLIVSGNVPQIGPIASVAPESLSHSIIPGAVVEDSFSVMNMGDTNFIASVLPDLDDFWLSLTEDSINIPPLDSGWVNFTIDGSVLSQWTTYSGTISVTGNDPLSSPFDVSVDVDVLGPTLYRSPGAITMNLDSAEVGTDSVKIRNDGYIALGVHISDSSGSYPSWLTCDTDSVLLSPGDSAEIVFTINASNEPLDRYSTKVLLASNDSSTGSVYLPVWVNIGELLVTAMNVNDRWNIVSLPVEPVSGVKTELFPTATTAAFAFDDGYVVSETLRTGAGYWLKFTGAQEVEVEGYTFSGLSVDVAAGWNLIGSLTENIPVTSVATSPGGILTSGFFAYDGGYFLTDSLLAGKGHWVQTSQAGQIILSASPAAVPKNLAVMNMDRFNALTVSDGMGNSQTLFFTGDPASLVRAEMPPRSPDGSFDARFRSDRYLEVFSSSGEGSGSKSITVRTTSPFLYVTAMLREPGGSAYVLRDGAGTRYPLSDGREIRIATAGSEQTILLLNRGQEALPREYALDQNYPNPFNPSTSISFSLPEEAMVTIRLYNILGNEVATVVNRRFEAGRHIVKFDAEELPSGVYIYRMQANHFVSGRKMVLMR